MASSSVAATATPLAAPAPVRDNQREAGGAPVSANIAELLDDPIINLMGGSLEAMRDDLAAKLARYNEIRVRRGFAPISNVRDVA